MSSTSQTKITKKSSLKEFGNYVDEMNKRQYMLFRFLNTIMEEDNLSKEDIGKLLNALEKYETVSESVVKPVFKQLTALKKEFSKRD